MIIGYFADGPWAHQALRKILADNGLRVAFICARFDNPDPVLQEYAVCNKIPFLTHRNVNSGEFMASIAPFNCDLFVSMSFNQIFRKHTIDFPPLGTINCHAGKLPFYRGRNILNWVLINDEREFGITVHYMDEGVDTGDIINQKTYPISDADNYATLLERAYAGCADILYESVKDLEAGTANRLPQHFIDPIGLYCTARGPGDEVLDWNQSSRDIFNFVRSICRPGPEARTFVRGAEIKINRVECIPEARPYKGIPGGVLSIIDGCLLVKTADSLVRVLEWSGDIKIRVGDRLK